MDFNKLNEQMITLDEDAMQRARNHWDSVAKPLGSLGLLEDAVTQLHGITGGTPTLSKRAVVVFCADNGVLEEGVAMTPQHITVEMARFIAAGNASVNVMAKQANADVVAVDIGMASKVEVAGLLDRRVAAGTKNMTRQAAMTPQQAQQAIQTGIDMAASLKNQGYTLFATGEMGIGNTTTSSAVTAVLLDKSAAEVTGRGVGLSDDGLQDKINAIEKAVALNQPDAANAADVLAKVGGFDIAGMVGLFLGGALHGVPVLIDGFISSVAALVAWRLCPRSKNIMFASHLSQEPAAGLVLKALGFKAPLHAEMRLGEGTGATAFMPLLDMALAVYQDVITYGDIGM